MTVLYPNHVITKFAIKGLQCTCMAKAVQILLVIS